MKLIKLIKLISILILFFVWCLVTGAWCPVFSQSKLDVSGGDIATPGLVLTPFPDASSPAQSSVDGEGKIYYNNTSKNVYISENSLWSPLGMPENVATIIVAASNSLDKDKAETAYQCSGTNDQVKINDAINDLPASGGAVYLLEGTYTIDDFININKSNVSLIGAGAGTILKKTVPTEFNVIYANSVSKVLISQLAIDGSRTGGVAIDFLSVNDSKIDKVWVRSIKEIAKAGIWLEDSSNNTISNTVIKDLNFDPDVNTDGLELAGSSSNNIISHNSISQCGESAIFGSEGSENNIICDNILIDATNAAGDAAIWLRGRYNVVCNNVISSSGEGGIYMDGDYCLISGNSLSDIVNSEGIVIGSEWNSITPSYAIVSNNLIRNSGKEGIRIGKSDGGNIISGNMIYDNGGASNYAGIFVDGDSDDNLISGNYIYDDSPPNGSGWGIFITNNNNQSKDNYIAANYIGGNAYNNGSEINDQGINTKYTGKDKITLEPVALSINANNIKIYPAGTDSGVSQVPTKYSPTSHFILYAGAARTITLGNGKAAGDLLILEGKVGTSDITINEAANVNMSSGSHALGPYDTLELIWNGTLWLEVSYTNVL